MPTKAIICKTNKFKYLRLSWKRFGLLCKPNWGILPKQNGWNDPNLCSVFFC